VHHRKTPGVGEQAAQQPHARDSALRASADGRSEFGLVLVSQGFQADVRAARVMQGVGRKKCKQL